MQNISTGIISIIIMSLFFTLVHVVATELEQKIIKPFCEKHLKIKIILECINRCLALILFILAIYYFGYFVNNL